MDRQADVAWWATALILRHLRKGMSYSQKDIVNHTNIPLSRYIRYENARALPTKEDEVLLCNVLQIPQGKYQKLVQTEINILTGKIAGPGTSVCIDYAALRNKRKGS